MNFQDASVVQTELNRINSSEVVSEHEQTVMSDIWLWGLKINADLVCAGKEPIKYDSLEDFVKAYWADRLS